MTSFINVYRFANSCYQLVISVDCSVLVRSHLTVVTYSQLLYLQVTEPDNFPQESETDYFLQDCSEVGRWSNNAPDNYNSCLYY